MSNFDGQLTAPRIKEVRQDMNMSIRRFAEFIGVDKSTLYSWETGKLKSMKAENLKHIAELCYVNVLWLFGYDVPKTIEDKEHETKRKKIESLLFKASNKDLDRLLAILQAYMEG